MTTSLKQVLTEVFRVALYVTIALISLHLYNHYILPPATPIQVLTPAQIVTPAAVNTAADHAQVPITSTQATEIVKYTTDPNLKPAVTTPVATPSAVQSEFEKFCKANPNTDFCLGVWQSTGTSVTFKGYTVEAFPKKLVDFGFSSDGNAIAGMYWKQKAPAIPLLLPHGGTYYLGANVGINTQGHPDRSRIEVHAIFPMGQ